jgi:hypothetical protein
MKTNNKEKEKKHLIMNTTIQYKGTIQWNNKVYSRPFITVSEHAMPHQNQLVVIHTGNSQFVVVPYSNQERIAGVVMEVAESY